MAKSKIIKDLANGSVTTLVALKRAKILLQEFDNDRLLEWVNHELMGYPDKESLPPYRIKRGQLFGSYFKGSIANHVKYTNVPLPIGKMPDDLANDFLSIFFIDGIEELTQLMETSNGQPIGKTIPADFYPSIALYNNDPYMNIISASVKINPQSIQGILTTVESKLLDLFCYLEKEFGILDELDIDVDSKTPEERQEIVDHISVLIYNDHRVSIGDNNRIKGSTIASSTE